MIQSVPDLFFISSKPFYGMPKKRIHGPAIPYNIFFKYRVH